jgi:hypothetical protein
MTALRVDDVRDLVRAGALLLLAATAARGLDWVFASMPVVSAVIVAFLLDLWAQRIGARWMPPEPGNPSSLGARRFFAGMGTGLAIGLFVVLAMLALGAAHVAQGRMHAKVLGFGLGRTAAYAFRDELMFRGVPLALMKDHVPAAWSLAFSVALAVAPIVLSAAGFAPIALTAASALSFAVIWQRGAGGFAAWATSAGWRIAIEVIAGGSVLEVAYERGALPSTEGAAGLPAYLGAAAFAFVALAIARRTK